MKELKDLILPITSIMATKETQKPLKGFVKPSQRLVEEYEDLLIKHVNGFDPNAYKLLAKAGFGQQSDMSPIIG